MTGGIGGYDMYHDMFYVNSVKNFQSASELNRSLPEMAPSNSIFRIRCLSQHRQEVLSTSLFGTSRVGRIIT